MQFLYHLFNLDLMMPAQPMKLRHIGKLTHSTIRLRCIKIPPLKILLLLLSIRPTTKWKPLYLFLYLYVYYESPPQSPHGGKQIPYFERTLIISCFVKVPEIPSMGSWFRSLLTASQSLLSTHLPK